MLLGTSILGFSVRFRLGDDIVPYFSIILSLTIGIIDAFLLILFIHHISTSIHVSHVILRVSRDLSNAIEKLFPKKLLQAAPLSDLASVKNEVPSGFDQDSRPIVSSRTGYLQAIDYEYLLGLAQASDVILRIHPRPGEFIVEDTPLASVWPASGYTRVLCARLNDAIFLGYERTLTQDVEFAINQLVEIAVRALSPGINDPFTAVRCLNRLGQGLIELSKVQWPSQYLYDSNQKVRLIIKTITFPKMVDRAFNLIRQNGIQSPIVMISLLETIGAVIPFVHSGEDLAALRLQAELVERGCRNSIPEEFDRIRVSSAYEALNVT
jgi:uncharacterized membrane protein